MIGGLPIHVLQPPLPTAGRRDDAFGLVLDALHGGLLPAAPALVIAPAGIACGDSEDEGLECAERLRCAARRTGVALVFGIDIGPPRVGSGRLYSCLGGAPVSWPAQVQRTFPTDARGRVLQLGTARVLPLFAAEALDTNAPRRLEALGALDAIVILSHGGATARWAEALARLERVAPVLVAAHSGGAGRAYASLALRPRWQALDRAVARAA